MRGRSTLTRVGRNTQQAMSQDNVGIITEAFRFFDLADWDSFGQFWAEEAELRAATARVVRTRLGLTGAEAAG